MKTKLLAGLSIIIVLVACQSNQQQNKTKETANENTVLPDSSNTKQDNKQLQEAYAGTLPCASCEGIKTELQIFGDNTYVLKETYLGKDNEKPIESTGKLNYERGFDKDNDATIYVLDYDKQQPRYCFVRFTAKPNQLLMLDKNRKIIKSKLNYTLNKL